MAAKVFASWTRDPGGRLSRLAAAWVAYGLSIPMDTQKAATETAP